MKLEHTIMSQIRLALSERKPELAAAHAAHLLKIQLPPGEPSPIFCAYVLGEAVTKSCAAASDARTAQISADETYRLFREAYSVAKEKLADELVPK